MSDDNPKTWHAIDVIVETKGAEAVEFAFTSLDALGTAINQLRKANAETVTVTGYFNELPDDKILHDELQHALQIYNFDDSALRSVTYGEIENTDWLAEWKKHWQPTIVGRFVIAPPWSDVVETERIVIRIEPNMAFGTGTHETTQLCLKAIGDIYDADQTFLDVGTGTGILAIAAAKLQVKSKKLRGKILACDTDTDSIKIAGENATPNGVDDKIEFSVGSVTSETPEFDFVCANLTLDVITPLLPLLLEKSRRLLLLSGILAEQEAAITDELRKLQITNFDIERSGEWISASIERS
jgi:ribosomal protein L11 methyltransferase